jgi:hypothetical protein
MDRPAVTALLTQLRDELESGKPVTEQERALLRRLATAVLRSLDIPQPAWRRASHAPRAFRATRLS